MSLVVAVAVVLPAYAAAQPRPGVSPARVQKKSKRAAPAAPAAPAAKPVEDAEVPDARPDQATPAAPGPGGGRRVDQLVAPTPDATGRIPFGPPPIGGKVPGTVRIFADRPGVRIFIDDRYMGIAPQVIHTVPAGDYVVEGLFADGSTVTRPLSVREGGDEDVQLIGRGPAAPEQATNAAWHRRIRTRTVVTGASGAGLVLVGAFVGVLEMRKQKEYNSAPLASPADERRLDDLGRQGRQLALAANVLYGVGGAGLVATAVLAYLDLRPVGQEANAPGQPAPTPLPVLSPLAGAGSVGAALLLQF